MSLERDIDYMKVALRQARKGIGRTSPNPCVGAVIVKGDRIIGRGFHKKAGTPHAEIHAIHDAGAEVNGSTMYVTLEPCNHTGRTPPCSHAVVRAGIKRVVVGMRDPNPLVDGSGIDYLEQHGVEVLSGVLEDQCHLINLPFFKHIATGLPLIVMKAGISLDGKLNYKKGSSGWITGEVTGRFVHRLRDSYDAIMVGSNTVRIDNPSLTTRLIGKKGRDPIRIILDRTLSMPVDAKVFSRESGSFCWVFCSQDASKENINVLTDAGVKVTKVPCEDSRLDLKEIFTQLGKEGVCSVLVEGGGTLHGMLLQKKLFDYAYLFQAPIFAGDQGVSLVTGYSAKNRDDAISLKQTKYRRLGEDIVIHGRVSYPK